METTFIPLDYGSFDWQGRNYVKITGRDDKGKRVCVIDSFKPYLWAILKEGTSEKKINELRKKLSVVGRNTPPIVTGGELLKMGFEPGPRIREILEAVREEQLKGGIDQKDISREYIDEIVAKKDSEDFISA